MEEKLAADLKFDLENSSMRQMDGWYKLRAVSEDLYNLYYYCWVNSPWRVSVAEYMQDKEFPGVDYEDWESSFAKIVGAHERYRERRRIARERGDYAC